jgi:hypothetical protein
MDEWVTLPDKLVAAGKPSLITLYIGLQKLADQNGEISRNSTTQLVVDLGYQHQPTSIYPLLQQLNNLGVIEWIKKGSPKYPQMQLRLNRG